MRIALTVLTLLGLVACTSATWHKQGADEAQVRSDLAACEAQAAQTYAAQEPATPTDTARDAQPTEPPERDEAASYGMPLQTDALGDAYERQRAVSRLTHQCMLAKGYTALTPE